MDEVPRTDITGPDGPRPDDRALRDVVLRVLEQVAPEVDVGSVDPALDLREQLDLDSMDILNLAIGLYEATGVEVPERDYRRVVTVDGAVGYLAEHGAA